MKKSFLFPLALSILLIGSPVLATTIDVFQDSDSASISTWISNLGGNVVVIEDFEGVGTGWYQELNTSIGTFKAGGDIGIGATSYNSNNAPDSDMPHFAIRDTAWYGRGNTTENGSNYLDSGDITEITLDLHEQYSYTNLFFYLQDPSDVGAQTSVESETAVYSFSNQANATSWFIGISSDTPLSSISWSTTNQNDGYGLDDFSNVAPVPEPATMLLLGTGLLGIAGFGRKKLFKK